MGAGGQVYERPVVAVTHYHKLRGLKQSNGFSHSPGGQSPRSSCHQAPPLGTLGSVPDSPASGGSKSSLTCGCLTPTSASAFKGCVLSVCQTPLCDSSKDLVIEFRTVIGPGGSLRLKILNLVTSAKTLFPHKEMFPVSGN